MGWGDTNRCGTELGGKGEHFLCGGEGKNTPPGIVIEEKEKGDSSKLFRTNCNAEHTKTKLIPWKEIYIGTHLLHLKRGKKIESIHLLKVSRFVFVCEIRRHFAEEWYDVAARPVSWVGGGPPGRQTSQPASMRTRAAASSPRATAWCSTRYVDASSVAGGLTSAACLPCSLAGRAACVGEPGLGPRPAQATLALPPGQITHIKITQNTQNRTRK